MGSKLVRITALVVSLAIGIGIVRSVITLSQKKGIIAERQRVLAQLMEKNRKLQDELKEATSPAFIEQEARNKLGLVREGETVVIMDQSKAGLLGTTDQQSQLRPWKQWWQLFF